MTHINDLRVQEESEESKINGTQDSIGLETKLKNLESTYTDIFWKVKQKIDTENSPLRFAIEGFRNSKEKFKEKVIFEYKTNNPKLSERLDLEQRCTQLFGSDIERVSPFIIPSFELLISYEKNELLQKAIVGKEDVDIARLIKKLGSDGWFRQGVTYMKKSEGVCPFCQKSLDESFINQVREYFDETYLSDLSEIEKLCDSYTSASDSLLSNLNSIVQQQTQFLKIEELKSAIHQLSDVIKDNKAKLAEKKSAPNIRIHLETIQDIAKTIAQLVTEANEAIALYNERIEHRDEEKITLISQVWQFITATLKDDIEMFTKEKQELNKSINLAKANIEALGNQILAKEKDLKSLEMQITSVKPTADGINAMLRYYGMTSFSLKVDANNKCYQFVRENGAPAYESLSEGEKTFVTFLYFMFSLKGNYDVSGHDDDKVVVIDDPVSSLDSDVLFIVGSMIRDLFRNIYNGTGTVKQLFVFSHNFYFFKEVSIEVGIKGNKTGYWMIKKTNNISKITYYDENPISSTYEMLWDEVRSANKAPTNSNSISLANTMRRIIEYYFHFLGGVELNQIHFQFPDGERQVFKSLISWANAGSHSAFDDFSATPSSYDAITYLKVFKDLFDKSGHISHYNMMMRIQADDN